MTENMPAETESEEQKLLKSVIAGGLEMLQRLQAIGHEVHVCNEQLRMIRTVMAKTLSRQEVNVEADLGVQILPDLILGAGNHGLLKKS